MREGDIFRFAETAAPGETMVYGRGERPPADLVQGMRPLVEAGALLPVRRRAEGGSFLFMVQRGRGSVPGPAARTHRVRPPRKAVRRSSLTMVFAWLVEAAKANRPCPTNAELAAACGMTVRAVRYRLVLLQNKGKISMVDHSPLKRRVATILVGRHAGKSTREATI